MKIFNFYCTLSFSVSGSETKKILWLEDYYYDYDLNNSILWVERPMYMYVDLIKMFSITSGCHREYFKIILFFIFAILNGIPF